MTAPEALASIDTDIDLYRCPGCESALVRDDERLCCTGRGHTFEIDDGIPLLDWTDDGGTTRSDVTQRVRAFYDARPFPDYDEFDSIASLQRKAREGVFARVLDEQLPLGSRVLEVGCGTGQLSSFLSIANRQVFATDLCLSSLRLGRTFAVRHGLSRVRFVQQNLFRPAFRPESFQLVVCNGVLHHTSDPFLAFRMVATMVKPGGYVLIGLYHRYGRLITDLRRVLFRLSGDRLLFLDRNLRGVDRSKAKKLAWFADQYAHPHETRHSIAETTSWVEEIGFDFVRSVPSDKPTRTFTPETRLFEAAKPGSGLERLAVDLGMVFRGSREGGFFIVIARRPES